MDEETRTDTKERIIDYMNWMEGNAVNEFMAAIRSSDQEGGSFALGKLETLWELKKEIFDEMYEEKLS